MLLKHILFLFTCLEITFNNGLAKLNSDLGLPIYWNPPSNLHITQQYNNDEKIHINTKIKNTRKRLVGT